MGSSATTGTAAGRLGLGDGERLGLADLPILIGLVAVACSVVVLGVVRGPGFSVYDEPTHLDFVWKLAAGQVPFAGDTLAPEVLAEWACRSQDNIPDQIPSCGPDHPPGAYPAQGQNYNFFHPPLYYGVSALFVRTSAALSVDLSFVTVARLTGALWLAAGLVGMYALMRVWSVSRISAASAAAVLAAVPSVAHAASTVNNDGAAVVSGVVAFWVLTRVVRQDRLGWLAPTLATLLVASTKVINAVALLSVALLLLLLAAERLRRGRPGDAFRIGTIVAGVLGAVALVHLGWAGIQDGRGIPGWTSPIAGFNTTPITGGPWDEWLPTLTATFGLTHDFYLQASLAGVGAVVVARGLSVLLTAAPFVNVAVFARGDVRRLVGWVAIVGALAVPVIVQLNAYAGSGSYFPRLTSRYGMTLVPLTVAAIVLVADARGWRRTTAVVAAACVGLLLLTFAGVL